MKVFLSPPQPDRGLQRIADALTRYAPAGVEVTNTHAEADLVVIYAIGRRERILGQTRHLLDRRKKYAIVQVCLRSTMSPHCQDWLEIWNKASIVWSYYDLLRAMDDDGVDRREVLPNLLHAPLGVDSAVFYPRELTEGNGISNYFVVSTSGLSYLSESVRECWVAAQEVCGNVLHVGPIFRAKSSITFSDNCSDDKLAWAYSQCQFASGLRRKEGFELPAAEGLLCGARPILFDTPDYRWNYKHWAEYIEETDRQGVIDQLVQLFKRGARPVTPHEIEEARHWFNWERVCGEFWQRCL